MLEVLMFGWEFPPHISGGLGTACHGLVKGLLENEVKVHFLVPKAASVQEKEIDLISAGDFNLSDQEALDAATYKSRFDYQEVDVMLLPYVSEEVYQTKIDKMKAGSKTLTSKNHAFSGTYGTYLFEEVHRYGVIATKIAKVKKFQIIHAHDWTTFPAGVAVKNVSGKPLIVHVHATEFDRSGENVNQRIYDIEKEGMYAADKVIAVSNFTKRTIVERYGVDPSKIAVVYNAVEKEPSGQFNKLNFPEKVVTFLGRVTFQKGPDYFVEAASRVLKKYSNVRFVMAGSGDMLKRMVERVGQLRIASKFHFTGFLNKHDVQWLLKNSDVYVMPSVSEPFGISALEALQNKVPVIISKQSGVSEVLHHAIKVDFWDVEALADAIHGVLQYPAVSKKLKSSGSGEVEQLQWSLAGSKVKSIYQSLIS